MFSIFMHKRRAGLAAVALGLIGSSQSFAAPVGTPSAASISNTATVNYSVSSVVQTPVTASTAFTVDTVIKFAVTGALTTNVAPGQTNAVTVFTLTNTSNIASNFTLAGNNQTGDDFQMNTPGTATAGVIVRVDSNSNGIYEPATDATSVTNLASGDSVQIIIIGDVPSVRVNGDDAIVQFIGTAINPATSAAWVNNTGADVQGGVAQIVVGNATASATDTYVVLTAALAVSKNSTVIRDPFNTAVGSNPKAIPQAIMEYSITVNNTGGAPATLQSISDPIPANTTFLPGDYPGTRDVRVVVGAVTTYCIAEAGSDGNVDGCFITGAGALSVGTPAVTNVNVGTPVVVSFRVRIN